MENYIVFIKCKLAIPIRADSINEARIYAKNYSLPKECIKGTSEILDIVKEEKGEETND